MQPINWEKRRISIDDAEPCAEENCPELSTGTATEAQQNDGEGI